MQRTRPQTGSLADRTLLTDLQDWYLGLSEDGEVRRKIVLAYVFLFLCTFAIAAVIGAANGKDPGLYVLVLLLMYAFVALVGVCVMILWSGLSFI